jgi:hypothetical protein
MVSFLQRILINTDGIDPYQKWQKLFMGFYKGCEKGMQILSDGKMRAIDENASARVGRPTHIGTCII